jgi:PIN domain nuclease of toxin-antitoxin system
LIWLHRGHRRARKLARHAGRIYASPATLLELQFLVETGRLQLRGASTVRDLLEDERFLVDDPPALAWFEKARGVGWTHDPFDRLLVAHASLRGWRLATGDEAVLDRVGAAGVLAL